MLGQPAEALLPDVGRAAHSAAAQAARGDPAGQAAQVEEEDARDPEGREPRQVVGERAGRVNTRRSGGVEIERR